MVTNRNTGFAAAVLLPLSMMISSCGTADEGGDEAAATTQSDTLVEALNANDDMDTLSEAISNAQLGGVFDGAGSYTILAPTDAAFEKLGQDGAALMTQEQRPILVGVLRNHIISGHLTRDAIEQAIEDGSGEATMQTVGGGDLTFSSSDGTITVSHSAGGTAKLGETASEAVNGIAIPIDTVMLPDPQ